MCDGNDRPIRLRYLDYRDTSFDSLRDGALYRPDSVTKLGRKGLLRLNLLFTIYGSQYCLRNANGRAR